jgi:hypothetical protein
MADRKGRSRPRASKQAAALTAAYRATKFRIESGAKNIVVRIGKRSPAAEALIRRARASCGAYITAHNPGSHARDDRFNRQAQFALHVELAAAGYETYHGAGTGPDPSWAPEPSLFVIGMSKSDAVKVAREYGQLAFVFIELGRPAELVWVRRPKRLPAQAPAPVLVYSTDGDLVFAMKERAELVSQINSALRQARTWGEFRRRVPKAAYSELICAIESAGEPRPRSAEAFEGLSLPMVADGLYPPWLAQEMPRFMPAEILKRYGRYESTSNGGVYRLRPEDLGEIRAQLVDLGFRVEEAGNLQFH